jgi:hypothetical protein
VEPLGQDEIRKSFVNCSRGEAKGLTFPAGFDETRWADLDYFGWRDPRAVNRAYLVVWHQGEPVGLALRAATQPTSRSKSAMCGFCQTVQVQSDITLFSAPRAGKSGREGNTLGTYACSNLACSRYLRRELKSEAIQPQESGSLEYHVSRLETRLHKFVDQVFEQR